MHNSGQDTSIGMNSAYLYLERCWNEDEIIVIVATDNWNCIGILGMERGGYNMVVERRFVSWIRFTAS